MQLVILIPLTLMIFSDYKSRTVVLWQLLLFGLIVLVTSTVENGIRLACTYLTINIFTSLLVGLSVCTYFWIRYRSVQSIIGKGDILFILFLTPLFPPRVFLVFMLVSFTVTLLTWCIYTLFRGQTANIPLISGVGTCLCISLVYQQLTLFS